MRSQSQSPLPQQTTSGPHRAVIAAGLLFTFLAFELCFLPAQTTEKPAADPDHLEEPARIFIPYDEQFQAVRDGYVWVPESFHHRLFDQIRGQVSDTGGWQLTEAFYEGSVNYDSFTQTCSLFHLNAVYTVILDTSRTTIRLPMMPLPPDGKFLFDREPIFPILRENEVLFEIEHSSPGKHRLEFSLMPPVLNSGSGNSSENDPGGDTSQPIGGEITIPRIPSSRLLLHLPPDAPPIRVNGALGTTEIGTDTLLVQLGAVDRITIERREEPGRVGHATIEAEQLFILRARSTQASLSARFRFRITGGKVQSLAIENDPRFFLSQCSCEEAELTPTVQRAGQQSDKFRVSFKKPVSGLITLRVDYVIRDFSGIGRIRLPKINAAEAKITRSWLALYEGPTVEFVHLPPGDVTPAAFQNLWSSEDPPLAVYDIIAARPNWVVSIRQRESSFSVRQRMDLTVEPAWTKIRCTADISTEGELFRLPLTVPEDLTIDSVSVLGERGESPEVSVRRADSRVYLAFRNPIEGNYTVDLDGRLPTAIDQTEKFPTVSLTEGDQTQFALNIYRSPEVLVQLEGEFPSDVSASTAAVTGGQPQPPPEGMIFVAGSSAPSADFLSDLSLTVQRNLADFTCQTRQILYNHPSGDWGLFCDFAIEAQSGAIDHFDIDLDEYCGSDLVIEPDVPRKITPLEKGIRVTLTPREPITKTFSFRLRTPVHYPTEAIRLPSVKMVFPAPQEDNFRAAIYLPIADAMKQVGFRWNHSHLRRLDTLNRTEGELGGLGSDRSGAISALAAAAFPAVDREEAREMEDFPPIITQLCGLTQNDFYVYESTSPAYQATLSVGRKTAAVIGNESVFFVRSNGEIYGRTSLDLRTGVSETYELRTAQHASILKLTLDSIPVTPRPIAPGRWQLTIPPGNNINHLEILFLIPPDQSVRIWSSRSHYARLDLVPATFEKIPTARLFWTVVFESHTAADSAACNISQIASDATANTPLPQTAPPRDENAYLPLDSPWKQPVFQSDAFVILSRFALERMRGQLDLLETASAQLSPDAPQTRLWLARWLMNWDECCRSVRSQISSQRAPHLFTSTQIKAIYESIAPDGDSGPWDSENGASSSGDDFREKRKIESLPLREVTEQDYLALIERYRKLLTDTGLTELAESIPRGETASPLSLWQLNHTGSNNQFLFGMTDKNIRSITLYRYNVVFRKAFRKMLLSAAMFLGTLLVFFLYLRVRSSGKRY